PEPDRLPHQQSGDRPQRRVEHRPLRHRRQAGGGGAGPVQEDAHVRRALLAAGDGEALQEQGRGVGLDGVLHALGEGADHPLGRGTDPATAQVAGAALHQPAGQQGGGQVPPGVRGRAEQQGFPRDGGQERHLLGRRARLGPDAISTGHAGAAWREVGRAGSAGPQAVHRAAPHHAPAAGDQL
ncbi:MAG: hypothetical protein AVDCRST_MAG77-1535, partial [uncultured Chloroflexi bacterium]